MEEPVSYLISLMSFISNMISSSFSSMALSQWAIQVIGLALTALILPGLKITSVFAPIVTVAVIGFINSRYWDTTLFFGIPNDASSHTLILLLMNGFIFWLVVKLLPGIEISGLFSALAAPVLMTVLNVLLSKYLPLIDWVSLFHSADEQLKSVKSVIRSTPIPIAGN